MMPENPKIGKLNQKRNNLVGMISELQERHYDKKSLSRSSFIRKVRTLNAKLKRLDSKLKNAPSTQKDNQASIELLRKNRTDTKIKVDKIKSRILNPSLKIKKSEITRQYREFHNTTKLANKNSEKSPRAKNISPSSTPIETVSNMLTNLKNSISLDSLKSGPKKKRQKGYYKEFSSGGTRHIHKDYSGGDVMLKKRGSKFNPKVMSVTAINKENIIRHLKEVHKK
jgi:hypothetical protein